MNTRHLLVLALVVLPTILAGTIPYNFTDVDAGTTCGGNCPGGNCPTCVCGTTESPQNIASMCSQYSGWSQTCCQCIVQHESGGNANAENYNSNGSTDIGLWQINSQNWAQCSGGTAPCSVSANLKCAQAVFGWGGNSFKLWSTCTACGCCSSSSTGTTTSATSTHATSAATSTHATSAATSTHATSANLATSVATHATTSTHSTGGSSGPTSGGSGPAGGDTGKTTTSTSSHGGSGPAGGDTGKSTSSNDGTTQSTTSSTYTSTNAAFSKHSPGGKGFQPITIKKDADTKLSQKAKSLSAKQVAEFEW